MNTKRTERAKEGVVRSAENCKTRFPAERLVLAADNDDAGSGRLFNGCRGRASGRTRSVDLLVYPVVRGATNLHHVIRAAKVRWWKHKWPPLNLTRDACVANVVLAAIGLTGLSGCGGRTDTSATGNSAAGDSSTSSAPCPMGASGPIMLATTPQSPQGLAVDATNVYWFFDSNPSGDPGPQPPPSGQVLQCAKCGCNEKPIVLADGQAVGAIAVDATSVYWTNGNLTKIPIGGGIPTTLARGAAGSLAVDSTSVYWTGTNGLLKVPTGGGDPTTLVSKPSVLVAVNSTSVYSTDGNGTIFGIPVNGGAIAILATGQTPSSLAVDAANVYWTNYNNGQPGGAVMKVSIAGGPPVMLAAGPRSPYAIAVDPTAVYWTTSSGAVLSVPLSGGGPTTLAFADPFAAPNAIAVDATSAYWTEAISGALMKLTPK